MTHFSPLFLLIDPLARPFFYSICMNRECSTTSDDSGNETNSTTTKNSIHRSSVQIAILFFSNSRLAWRHAVKCRETARRPISSWTRYAHMWVNHYDFELVCLSLARSRQRRRAGGLGEHAKKEFFIHEKAWRVKMSHRIWRVRSASSNLHDTNSDQPSTFLFWLIHPYHASVSS